MGRFGGLLFAALIGFGVAFGVVAMMRLTSSPQIHMTRWAMFAPMLVFPLIGLSALVGRKRPPGRLRHHAQDDAIQSRLDEIRRELNALHEQQADLTLQLDELTSAPLPNSRPNSRR
ncbi:MAG: hypothetical protein O3A46_15530 [Candidatus Poribacteria bacterium]|nr:hypothetical protein [Candidatus Poribacteria bacterium]